KVKAIFQALSKPVMKVIDKVVDFIVKAGKKLWAKLKGKGADRGDARSDSEKRAAVHSARLAGDRLLERPDATAESVQSQLPPLRQQHGVKKLDLVSSGGARHHIYAQLVEESGDDKTLSKTEKPDPPLKGPHDRHYLNRIRPSSRKKEKNTVILPGTDVQGDINLINEGKVEKIHGRYTVNRRTYEVENRTTLFPISGEGFIEMNRGAYLALQIYIENNGDTEEARLKLDRNAIGSEQREVALRVFRMRGG
ncbi:MAG: hypothetical protein ACRDJG_11170, partial [Actinomycetota bacterium]